MIRSLCSHLSGRRNKIRIKKDFLIAVTNRFWYEIVNSKIAIQSPITAFRFQICVVIQVLQISFSKIGSFSYSKPALRRQSSLDFRKCDKLILGVCDITKSSFFVVLSRKQFTSLDVGGFFHISEEMNVSAD